MRLPAVCMQPGQRCDLEGGPSIHILSAENDNPPPLAPADKQTDLQPVSDPIELRELWSQRCLSSATQRCSFLWHGAAPADPFLCGHNSTAPVGWTQCPRVAQCIQNDLLPKPAIDTGVWRPGVWCASPKTTAQETPAATVNPDLFILLSVDILLGGSRRDQILSGKSGITFPTHKKRTHPFPAPHRLAFPAHSASLGQKKLPTSCQKRDRRQRTWA